MNKMKIMKIISTINTLTILMVQSILPVASEIDPGIKLVEVFVKILES